MTVIAMSREIGSPGSEMVRVATKLGLEVINSEIVAPQVAGSMGLAESAVQVCAVHGSVAVQVFGRRGCGTIRTLLQPATEKRQGTKSREVGRWLAASAMGVRCKRRGRLGVGRPHDVACVSGAVGGHQSTVGISIGVRGVSRAGRHIDRRCWVERDRGRGSASATERDSRTDYRVSGS
jgi:hypothetical protein